MLAGMRFDIYGRLTLSIVREDERWRAYHAGEGDSSGT